MSDDQAPVTATGDTVPFYKSAVLRGLLVLAATWVLAQVKQHYKLDPAIFGVNADGVADLVLNAIAAGAVAYAAHGRLFKPNPPLTLKKQPSPGDS